MKRKIPGLIILVFSMLVAFQNCGRSRLAFEDLEISEMASFFAYPYKSTPAFYASMLLSRDEGAVTGLSELTFLGAAARPDAPTANIDYEVQIEDEEGNPLCPRQTGTLTGGATAIEFECVTSRHAAEVHVTMTLTGASATEVFSKIYRQ